MGEAVRSIEASQEDLRERVRGTLARLSQTGALPTLPSAATAALGLARDPDADIEKLCRVIQADVGLAARVLRMANSAAFGRRNPARRLQDAVATLGLRKTCDVLVAACARRLYEHASPRTELLWNHALAVGVATEQLARITRRADPGAAFLPGLFHDVGRIAFVIADETSLEVIESMLDTGEGESLEVEHAWYGFNHGEAAAILADDWGLAPDQCDAIRWHHEPERAGEGAGLASVINAADALAYTLGCGMREAPPSGVSLAAVGIAQDDATECAAQVSEALAVQRELLD